MPRFTRNDRFERLPRFARNDIFMERIIIIAGVLLIAALAAVLSYALSIWSSRIAIKAGAVDQPTGGRKIHNKPIPLFGGLGISITILIGIFLLFSQGLLVDISLRQVLGFAAAIVILLVGGLTDDSRPRPAGLQIIFPILASITVIASGTGIIQVTGFADAAPFSLTWWRFDALNLSFPADLITVVWLLFATYATKLLDGLDGLVTGMAAIGAVMVGALTLSPTYFQPGVAMLAGVVGGSFAGFLPRNIHPAKQFLGEAGSTLAGFSLGFLAIVSSAKIAIALAVLAIPIADAVLVVIGRIRRGVSPWKGDSTHLHFRMLNAGIPHRTAVALLWGVSMAAGVFALTLQTRGKIFLVAVLVVLTALWSWWIQRRQGIRGLKNEELRG